MKISKYLHTKIFFIHKNSVSMAIFKYIINIYTYIALHKYFVLLYFNHIHFCAKLITIKNEQQFIYRNTYLPNR